MEGTLSRGTRGNGGQLSSAGAGPPLLLVRWGPPPLALDMKLVRRSCCVFSRCSS